MAKNIQEERYRWIKPILEKDTSIKNMAKVCPYSERSLKRWLSVYRAKGYSGLIPKSTRPKSNPKELSVRARERILEIRKKKRKCALKIKWELEKEGVSVHKNTIHKLIKKEGLTRKYRTKKIKLNYVKIPLTPGELVEIDIKYVPERLEKQRYYQFTAIDNASRWRYLKIYNDMSNISAIDFLKEVIRKAEFNIKAIKTDNGSCFTNRYTGYLKSSDPYNPRLHPLDLECQRFNIIHYLIDPGKPAQNGKVERSHRSDQEMFYDRNRFKSVNDLKRKIRTWNNYYNNLEHCGLNGLTPNEFLKKSNYLLNTKVTNVCV